MVVVNGSRWWVWGGWVAMGSADEARGCRETQTDRQTDRECVRTFREHALKIESARASERAHTRIHMQRERD